MEEQIGIHHPNQSYLGKVQSLAHHLCADKDIRFSPLEMVDNLLEPIFPLGGIHIHTLYTCLREKL